MRTWDVVKLAKYARCLSRRQLHIVAFRQEKVVAGAEVLWAGVSGGRAGGGMGEADHLAAIRSSRRILAAILQVGTLDCGWSCR